MTTSSSDAVKSADSWKSRYFERMRGTRMRGMRGTLQESRPPQAWSAERISFFTTPWQLAGGFYGGQRLARPEPGFTALSQR